MQELPQWLETLRSVSAALVSHPDVHDTNARITAQRVVRRYVNTEGTRIRFPETRYRVFVWAGTTAEDGMELSLSDYVDARSEAALPESAARWGVGLP